MVPFLAYFTYLFNIVPRFLLRCQKLVLKAGKEIIRENMANSICSKLANRYPFQTRKYSENFKLLSLRTKKNEWESDSRFNKSTAKEKVSQLVVFFLIYYAKNRFLSYLSTYLYDSKPIKLLKQCSR